MKNLPFPGARTHELNTSQVQIIMRLLDKDRKYHEQLENYEQCSELKKMIDDVGNYCLGYTDVTQDVSYAVYYVCMQHGDLVNPQCCFLDGELLFFVEELYLTLYMTGPELRALEKINKNEDDKRKTHRK